MCTVTYLPINKTDFILTSSRDVPFARAKALFPKKYIEDNVSLTYPKDGKAGGTWIGVSSKNRLICLLNGAFKCHASRAVYKKSRGQIVKDLLKADAIFKALNVIDLTNIEQFTLVIVDWNDALDLMEFVWDGNTKHFKKLAQKPYIWSSATLYDASVKKLRQDWFLEWQKNNIFSKNNILNFHYNAGVGDASIDVQMNRGLGGTVSITQVVKILEKTAMTYVQIR